jgi:pilus assembly protein Flp/PilA
MKSLFTHFAQDESGATAIEYGLIAGLVSVVIIVAVTTAGQQLNTVWTSIGTALATVPGG